jgi:CheY-like chemotaxis protein
MQGTLDNFDGKPHADPSAISMDEPGGGANTLLRKLLLVDDEPDGAEFAAALLHSHGLDVTVVHSAHEALHVLESDKDIDAVLSDVIMPGMTGLQLAETIRAMYPAVKIVLMSGYTVPELLTDSERPYLFATKPYRIDAILKLLRS